MRVTIPTHLTDAALESAVKSLARGERETTAQLVAHLAELEERRLHLRAGFSSLYTYCTTVLQLSECAAYNRIEAARMARRFPPLLDRLADGSLNLRTTRLLAPLLNAENGHELVAAACGKTKLQVEELVARYAPRPDVAASVRKLPAPRLAPIPPAAPASLLLANSPPPVAPMAPAMAPGAISAPSRPPLVSPLAPDRYQIRFTARAETCEKLRLAQDMLRHAIPTGDPAEIIDRALTLLLEDLARKKFAATKHPRPRGGTAPGSRDLAAKLRRAVWRRDGGRCAFRSKSGRRCNERAFLEFHHLDPHGVGGEATVANIELRCRAHNLYEAELFYGRSKIDERRARSGTIFYRRDKSSTKRSTTFTRTTQSTLRLP
jgi:hypothetical protein